MDGQQSEDIIGYEHKEWTDLYKDLKIFQILCLTLSFQTYNPQIFIEGYSFGSKGQGLFQIAENCGILKYRLTRSFILQNVV